jgi:hypothetical protein
MDARENNAAESALDMCECEHSPGEVCADASDIRCACGSLIARKVPRGYELKCRRCKRTLLLVRAAAVLQAVK